MIKALVSTTAAALAVCVIASPAHAVVGSRIWVSGHGVDQAGCGAPTAPCRSLQYAHDNIASGGEIDILDPAGYGAVTITKAISIVNDGVGTAGVQATSGAAITINAGAGQSVLLKGLNIDGLGSALNGIAFNSGGNLTIIGCVIRHAQNNGILLEPASGAITVLISNTTSSDNVANGLYLLPVSGGATVAMVLDHVTASNNSVGVVADSTSATEVDVSLVNSVASNNSTYGAQWLSGGAILHVSTDSSVMNMNGIDGLFIFQNADVSLSRSVLDLNGHYGVENQASGSGAFESTHDNRINSNKVGDILGPAPTLQALQ